MNIVDRIEQASACDVINLRDAEKRIYIGSGWKLARFIDNCLVEFFDPMKVEFLEDAQAMTNKALKSAIVWIANAEGEVWLVMCSCYQLCEPRRVVLTDSSALAHMARVFAEQNDDLR